MLRAHPHRNVVLEDFSLGHYNVKTGGGGGGGVCVCVCVCVCVSGGVECVCDTRSISLPKTTNPLLLVNTTAGALATYPRSKPVKKLTIISEMKKTSTILREGWGRGSTLASAWDL